MCHTLPAIPSVSSQSAGWVVTEFAQGRTGLQALQISTVANPFEDTGDNSEPRYELYPGNATVPRVVLCNKEIYSHNTCAATNMNGRVVYTPPLVFPEGGSDHHFAYDDFINGWEVDFWLSDLPAPTGGNLSVGGAGICVWGSPGTGCSGSTATSLDTSMGGINADLLQASESDPVHGSLPYAISTAEVCNDISANFVYPATSSDGDNADQGCANSGAGYGVSGQGPPEGTRWFLALHDAQVNTISGIKPFQAVILRTLDEDHYGGTITDTNWNGSSWAFFPQFNRGNYSFAAAEAGVSYNQQDVTIPLVPQGFNVQPYVRFCSNGTC